MGVMEWKIPTVSTLSGHEILHRRLASQPFWCRRRLRQQYPQFLRAHLLSPSTDISFITWQVFLSGEVDSGYVYDSYGKIALRRRIAPAMHTVSTPMVTSATAMATALTVIPTGYIRIHIRVYFLANVTIL